MSAGRPSQEKVLPVAPEATLSQQQAEDIVKAAASKIATRKVRQECTSEIPRSEQMRVETIGAAREVLSSNNCAQQLGIVAMQVDQLRTVPEVMKTRGQEFDSALRGASKLESSSGEIHTAAVTADNGVAASLENTIVPWSQPSGSNAEGKYAPQVAVMTCTPVTGSFELFDRSQVRSTSAEILQGGKQLNEKKVVKPQARREVGEHQIPTVAQDDTNYEMLQALLQELEELDKPHEWSEDDEAMIDALMQELELTIAFPVGDERIELIAKLEGNELLANPDVSAENISEDNGASSSEATMEAEGRCGSKRSHLTGRFERPNRLIPVEVIQQRPTLCHRRRLWISHRKHGRWKHERQQMGLRGLCWPTHRKHGRWKADKMVMPPLPMQLKPEGTRRWSSRRKRSMWKSVNRCSV